MNETAQLFDQAQQYFAYSQLLRRNFHRHPELGYKEFRTAEIVARELSQLGLQVRSGLAETGIVGLLEGEQPGRVVMLRFDMDALPILEETQTDYASEIPGVMHACGHDGHMAIGLTVARILQARKNTLTGTFKFVFQPAEEGLGGAERMIAESVLGNPPVDVSLALHLWNERPLGWIGVSPGAMMAGADFFTIKIKGKGGHGAMPETTHDPVVAAAQIVLAIQTIVSRNLSPMDTAVISVTQINAGTTNNVIPSEAVLHGTIRTFESHVRGRVIKRLEEVVIQVSAAMGCQAEIAVKLLTPPLRNHPEVAVVVRQVTEQLFPKFIFDEHYRSMGSEDMAFFLDQTPGCLFFVGSANSEKGFVFSHHHPKFDFDETVLPIAAALMAATAIRLTKE